MTDSSRNAGMDIAKAVCIVGVVIWHLQPITAAMLPADTVLALWGGYVLKFFYFDLTLLAVPSFILISLYLFFSKLTETGDYWKKRFLKLFQIYVFWVGIQFILYLLTGGPLPLPLKTIIRSGGPDLSFGTLIPVMPSIFYYLYILIFCSILSLLFFKLPDKIKIFMALAVIAASCVYFLLTPSYGIGIDTRSMKNYYLYVPAAYCLYRYKDRFIQYRWLFFIGFVLSIVAEWTFVGMTSAYGRLSVFLGAIFLVSFCLSGSKTASRPTVLLSRYSLGIFALHPYCMAAVFIPYAIFFHQSRAIAAKTVYEGLLLFGLTFALTCFVVWLMSKTKLRRYVS